MRRLSLSRVTAELQSVRPEGIAEFANKVTIVDCIP